ncbi:MAG: hypothetical protein Q8861_06355 [Bacteroidota bacterium]|nr:hypothetical protein [Bacteroidota bacterium]
MRRQIIFIFSIILLITACRHSSPKDQALLYNADRIMENFPDSALQLLKKIQHPQSLSSKEYALFSLLTSQALDKTEVNIQSDSLIKNAVSYYSNGKDLSRTGYSFFYLSRYERNIGNSQGQAESLLKALPYAIKSNDHKLLGLIYSEKASIYQEQDQLDSMIYYKQLAYASLLKARDKRNCIIMQLSIGYGYYQKMNFRVALQYYKLAETKATQINDTVILSSIYKFAGLALYYLKNYPEALRYARLCASISTNYNPDKWVSLAAIFVQMNQLDSAKHYLTKSINDGYKSSDCYELLEMIAEREKKYEIAVQYAKLITTAKDSVNRHSLATSFAGMEKKYNYERIATENKTLIIANQRNKIAVLFLLLGLSGIIVIVLLWRYRHKQIQLKQHQLLVEKEKENNQLLQQQINMQNALIKNVEHHKKTAIKRLVPSNSSYSMSEEGSVDSMALYDELISSIDGLYNGFSKRLKNKYPLLTTTDILICCLLRAGFESGMIASVLDTQTDSFNVRRARLRKKLEIEHGVNFADFLAEF